MSTSLLYHGLGLIDYVHQKTDYSQGRITLYAEPAARTVKCPECNNPDVIRKGCIERTFTTLPLGLKPIQLVTAVQRVFCPLCDIVRQIKLSFADPKKRYTRKLERYVLDLSKRMTIKDIAEHLQVSWDTVKDIQKQNLQRKLRRPRFKNLSRIAIDEISIGKGHKYITLVLDLKTGAVIFVGDGKGADALKPFWKRLKTSKARIQAVAADMSPAYSDAVRTNLPEAKLVFDRFHIMKLFNDKLSDYRTSLQRELSDPDQQRLLKGTRWLLLKNPCNLDSKKNEKQRLEKALEINKPLATAYYLKDDLRELWTCSSKKEASFRLRSWIRRAVLSNITMLKKFASTLIKHRHGILAYYDCPISTGPLEGTNNKIKTMKRQAYGFRDREFFELKIKTLHETRYALIG